MYRANDIFVFVLVIFIILAILFMEWIIYFHLLPLPLHVSQYAIQYTYAHSIPTLYPPYHFTTRFLFHALLLALPASCFICMKKKRPKMCPLKFAVRLPSSRLITHSWKFRRLIGFLSFHVRNLGMWTGFRYLWYPVWIITSVPTRNKWSGIPGKKTSIYAVKKSKINYLLIFLAVSF